MKYFIAIVLVIVSVTSAVELPINARFHQSRGFRRAPILRSQRQEVLPAPAASYGPPPQVYGPPSPSAEELTTTETPYSTTTTEPLETTTTLETPAQKIRVNQKLQEPSSSVNPAGIYVVVPQTQNYAISQKFVAQQQQQPQRLIPVQAVPAFAKIQEVPQYAQIVEYQYQPSFAAFPAVTSSSAYTSIVNTPYSSSFIQSFQ